MYRQVGRAFSAGTKVYDGVPLAVREWNAMHGRGQVVVVAWRDEVRGVVHAVIEFSWGQASCRDELVRFAVSAVALGVAATDVVRRARGRGKPGVLLPGRTTGAVCDGLDAGDVAEGEGAELEEEERTGCRVLDACM